MTIIWSIFAIRFFKKNLSVFNVYQDRDKCACVYNFVATFPQQNKLANDLIAYVPPS